MKDAAQNMHSFARIHDPFYSPEGLEAVASEGPEAFHPQNPLAFRTNSFAGPQRR